MIKGLYTSASSMLPRMGKQEAAANNLANLNTVGYKRDGVFLRTLVEAKQSLSGYYPEWRNTGPMEVVIDFSQGPLKKTGSTLDLAIQGDGFFTILMPEGERYTRNGSFTLSPEGVLTTLSGYPVLGKGGTIVLRGGEVKIHEKGELIVDGVLVDTLEIRDFEQPYRMMKVAGDFFLPKEEGDRGGSAENMILRQGFLEESNVKPIQEMVDMLVVYRNYESDQRAVQVQDETLRKAVNEVGAVR